MILTKTVSRILTGTFLCFCIAVAKPGHAQSLVSRYAIDFLRGPGTYLLADGTAGQGNLQFKTRGESVLYVNKKQKFSAPQVRSFTINGHMLVPQGIFDFEFGLHSYHAENAFIEYADTTGPLQLAMYYTAEPTGNTTSYFTTFLVRQRGKQAFETGPDNNNKWRKAERQRIAPLFARWPELQQAVLSGAATFENFPGYVRQANQQGQ